MEPVLGSGPLTTLVDEDVVLSSIYWQPCLTNRVDYLLIANLSPVSRGGGVGRGDGDVVFLTINLAPALS